jgi:curved DNA-binding protein CbpA
MVRVTIEEAYEILGVGKLSNIEEVKSAYRYLFVQLLPLCLEALLRATYSRRLALQTHPDRNKDDPVAHQKFLKVSEAFRRIIDPDVLEICVQVEDEELEGEAGDSEDGDYDYVESDEYEEEDYEAMFAFRMFEKMFAYGGGGGGVDGAPMGSTSGGKEKRSVCTCWECRNSRSFFLPKPPSKYIPKSQRPKDPELESKKAAPPSDPHENWLSDDDVAGAGGAGKKKAKKAGTSKKKNKKEKEKGKGGVEFVFTPFCTILSLFCLSIHS